MLGDPLGEQSRMLREDAEQVESPAKRGALLISLWFDPADDGDLRRRVSYECAAAFVPGGGSGTVARNRAKQSRSCL